MYNVFFYLSYYGKCLKYIWSSSHECGQKKKKYNLMKY